MGDVFITSWAESTFRKRYAFSPDEDWAGLAHRVAWSVCAGVLPDDEVRAIEGAIYRREFIPAGRYLWSCGRTFHQCNNCCLFRAEDSREGWGDVVWKSTMALMTGAGIGVDYSAVRPFGSVVKRTGGFATGPIALANMVNEDGRFVMQGGQRRSAIWGGLSWWHPDMLPGRAPSGDSHPGWLRLKDWPTPLRAAKAADLTFPLPMELTNISVIYDTAFFVLMKGVDAIEMAAPWGGRLVLTRALAERVWRGNCEQAFRTAEPGFSFNFGRDEESLRNACTEVVSVDDSDKCNLGTVWLNRIRDVSHMRETTRLATEFLLCGGVYSHVPTETLREVGDKNNRIGLGLGGIDEWLQARNYPYRVVSELHDLLAAWRDESDHTAFAVAERLRVSPPKGRRAIAPNGTIGILAETTTSIEPLFCKAYKRRYLDGGEWKYQYVVDGAARRLLDAGIPSDKIRDAYDLEFAQRVKFQADVQEYVDMAISSTCNMPAWGTPGNNAGTVEDNARTLLKYAKRLRGFTCYPDQARGGQPLERVDDLEFALSKEGVVFEEKGHECAGGVCGL